ncbi:hypothetical protein V8C42DRAFT_246972 [Trichoderma barbatum]
MLRSSTNAAALSLLTTSNLANSSGAPLANALNNFHVWRRMSEPEMLSLAHALYVTAWLVHFAAEQPFLELPLQPAQWEKIEPIRSAVEWASCVSRFNQQCAADTLRVISVKLKVAAIIITITTSLQLSPIRSITSPISTQSLFVTALLVGRILSLGWPFIVASGLRRRRKQLQSTRHEVASIEAILTFVQGDVSRDEFMQVPINQPR